MKFARFVVAGLSLALCAAGCLGTRRAAGPPLDPAPDPSTPVNAARLVAWSWRHQDLDLYATVLADDFVFAFAESDSAGNGWRDHPWSRADELLAVGNLFAAATSVRFDIEALPTNSPDPRPGKQARWHQVVYTPVAVQAVIQSGPSVEVREAHGWARFYFVRGDSAAIPPELLAHGVTPDSTQWWLERWEDETLPSGLRAHPALLTSLGNLKAAFHP